MKIRIEKKYLLETLHHVMKGISTKNLIPILNCLKIEVEQEGIFLTSTNNDISIKTFIPSNKIEEIEETGTIVVYARLFYEYIRKLPEGIINLEELIDNKLKIFTETSSSDINCNNKDDFPKLNFEEKKDFLTIEAEVLKDVINKIVYASSTSEERPNLTGMNLKVEENKITCSATDSYRVATKIINLEKNSEENYNIIIPTKNLTELVKILENFHESVEIHIFNSNALFKIGDMYFMSRLINSSFPNIDNLIPKEFEIEIEVNLHDFFSALDRTSLLSREESKQTVNLHLDGDKINLKAIIPEIGKVEESIMLEKNSNKSLDISFSSKYMMDALRSLNSSTFILLLNKATTPIIIKSAEEKEFIQLFQPIRTY